MSRIGKIPVKLVSGVKAAVEPGGVRLEGPKGKLTVNLPHGIKVEQKDDELVVTRLTDTKQSRANHGTIRAVLKNSIDGVATGHKRDLEIQGVGFRAQLKGQTLVLNLGLSHQVEFNVPQDVKILVPQPTSITVEGTDKIYVGQIAAKIRDIKPPEPYKGKGIRYTGETVRRKQGKSVTK